MKKITILMNTSSPGMLSFEEVKQAIANEQELIVTQCVNFAQFCHLDKGYEVEVARKNEAGTWEYVVLSELLENNRPYINKEMRRAHNVAKMLVAGGFDFLPKSVPDDKSETNGLKKYFLGNYLRGGFEGEFASVDEAWSKLGTRFLQAFPCDKMNEEGEFVENPDGARFVVMRVHEVNAYGIEDTPMCKKGDFGMKDKVNIEADNFKVLQPIFFM